jgi:hypothetical protein
MRSARDPRLIDLLTWAVGKGAKTFQQLTITDDARLVASTYVPHFDFACVVPASLTFSILDLAKASQLPNALKVGPRNYASPVAWLPGANWGTVALTIHATATALQRDTDLGRAAQLSLLAEYCAEDDAALTEQARKATRSPQFRDITRGVVATLGTEPSVFNEAFALMYCATRRVATPLWSEKTRSGAKLFERSAFNSDDAMAGDVLGLVPLIDLARHSSNPTCVVGLPERDMRQWLVQERGCKPNTEYYVLQTTRALNAGDELTVDRNASFGFKDEEFEAWFGRPYDDSRLNARDTESIRKEDTPTQQTGSASHDDIFF